MPALFWGGGWGRGGLDPTQTGVGIIMVSVVWGVWRKSLEVSCFSLVRHS